MADEEELDDTALIGTRVTRTGVRSAPDRAPRRPRRGARDRFAISEAGQGQGLWLAVDEVIHHDDVLFPIIIRPRGDVAARDPHPGDARVVKHDAEEGQAPIARRGRDEAAEQQLAVGVEVLHQRAGPTVSALLARPAPIRLVNVREDRAEASDRCRVAPLVPGTKNKASVMLLPTGVNRRNGLKVLKMVP